MSKPITEDLKGHSYHDAFACRTFTTAGVKFHIGIARGRMDGRTIQTEHNGIFLICLSDKKLVLDRYRGWKGRWQEDEARSRVLKAEVRQITQMTAAELEDFIENNAQACHNPFWQRRRAADAAKGDLHLRKDWTVSRFTDSTRYSAATKRALVHELERFIVARTFGGSAYARPKFGQRIYALMVNDYGIIEFADRNKFYAGMLHLNGAFIKLLEMIGNREDLHGLRLPARAADLHGALSEIACAYAHHTPIA